MPVAYSLLAHSVSPTVAEDTLPMNSERLFSGMSGV